MVLLLLLSLMIVCLDSKVFSIITLTLGNEMLVYMPTVWKLYM